MTEPELQQYYEFIATAWRSLNEAKTASDSGDVATYEVLLRKSVDSSEQAQKVLAEWKRKTPPLETRIRR